MKLLSRIFTAIVTLWLIFRGSRRSNIPDKSLLLQSKADVAKNEAVLKFRRRLINDFRTANFLSLYAEVPSYMTMFNSSKPLTKYSWLTPELLFKVYGIKPTPEAATEPPIPSKANPTR